MRRARDTSVLMALAEQLVSHRSNTSHRQRSLYLPFLFPLVRSVPLSHRLRPICGVRMFARFPCLSTLSRLGPLAKLSRQLVSWNVCNRGSLFNEKHLLLTKLKTNVSPQLVFSYWLDAGCVVFSVDYFQYSRKQFAIIYIGSSEDICINQSR